MTDPLRRLTPVVRIAPAKLNLTLAVVGRRPDGYHDLHSVMAPLELADRLSLLPTTGAEDRLHVSGRAAGPDRDNLVLRAVGTLRERLGGTTEAPRAGWNLRPFLPPLAIRLDKRIPVAAGLGGGSSDAAAAIDGALEAWAAELDADARLAVALALGSDVPFFLAGGAAVVSGRGETVTPVVGVTGVPPGILLVTPAVPVPTGAVFAALAASAAAGRAPAGSTRVSSQHLAGELQRGITGAALLDRAGILASANDLAPATALVVPEIVPFRRALMRTLNRPVGQSGSGPTLWVLYPSGDDAEAATGRVLAALETGTLVAPGDGPPAVIATRLATRPAPAAQGATA